MLKQVKSGQIHTIALAGMFSILESDTFDVQAHGVRPKENLLLPLNLWGA